MDNENQGLSKGYKMKTGTINSPYQYRRSHKLPKALKIIKPFNKDVSHIDANGFKHSKLYAKSDTGLSLVFTTIDSLDEAEVFIKRLFSEGLIAQAERTSGFDRHYLQFG